MKAKRLDEIFTNCEFKETISDESTVRGFDHNSVKTTIVPRTRETEKPGNQIKATIMKDLARKA